MVESDKQSENEKPLNNTKPEQKDKDINKINSLKSKDLNGVEVIYNKVKDDEGDSDGRDSPVERVKFQGIDDDSICSEESEDEKLPPIPDGGWGWVVVIAAFLVSACADGLAFSFGLLHEEFTRYFNATQSETSLIGSLFIATPLLAGPIMSTLVDRLGCRIMTVAAAILSAAGFLLASISNSVPMLCLTFGFISGLAMGIFYVTSVVSVAFWFDKRRNFAMSLASCGIGFGTLIYSPMTYYFLEIYDWRNTIVMLAGTLLNMCVCGVLMRNPEWLKIKLRRDKFLSRMSSRRSSSAGSISSRSLADSVYLDADELEALFKSGQSPEVILATLASNIAEAEELEATTQMNVEQSMKRIYSALQLPTFIQQNEKVPTEVIESLMENKKLYNIILQNYPHVILRTRSDVNINVDTIPENVVKSIEPAQLPIEIKAMKPKSNADAQIKDELDLKLSKEELESKLNEVKKLTDSQKIATSEGDVKARKPKIAATKAPVQPHWIRRMSNDFHLKDIPLYRNTMMHRGAMMTQPRFKAKATSLPDMYRNSMWSLSDSDDEMRWYDRLWSTIKKTFDFSMFTEFHFLMFNLSALILSVWFIVPYFFLNSYMTERNVDGGALMISIIGVASSIGIVGLGWAGDQPWINVTKTFAACLIVCGISIAAYPLFITNFWALCIISAIFGISFASSYAYTPAMLMVLMPMDKFTVAYGLILLSEGLGHLIGPPIGGLLYDLTGTWELTFYMGGLFVLLSGVCVGVIPYTRNLRICGNAPLLKDAEVEASSFGG